MLVPGLVEAQTIAEFERDGVVLLPGVISSDWLVRLNAAVERQIANPGPYFKQVGAKGYNSDKLAWRRDAEIAAYVKESPLPALAGALLRSRKVNLLLDQLFSKIAGTPEAETPWHHDQVVFPVQGTQTVSFWMSLTPVTHDTGALKFVRGSHRWGRLFQPTGFDGKPIFTVVEAYEQITPDFGAEPDKYDIVCWDMQPGDLVAFSFLTLHGASGNTRSDQPRHAYTIRYTGDDVVYAPNAASTKELLVSTLTPGRPLDCAEFPEVWRAV
jgi:ectoine hydroxylase-related dioxygenase (phytanoyl-CoA dioxygenase family)